MSRAIPICLLVCSVAFGIASPVFAGDDVSKVNGSIRIDEGRSVGDLDTVNGSIELGDNGQADEVSTVNGSIEIGDNASIQSADTVNGRVVIGKRARIAKDIDTVNGALTLAEGSDVSGNASNVNGSIRLQAAHIGGGIKTVSGDIEVGADSRVDGGILVEKSTGWFFYSSSNRPPRIVIGPRAVVRGKLVFERDVELHVSDTATVGEISGATPIKFSGANP